MGMQGKLSKPNHIRLEGERGEFPYHLKLHKPQHSQWHATDLIRRSLLYVHQIHKIKQESTSQERRDNGHALVESSICFSTPASWLLLLLIWTKYLFAKNTMQHRIYCHNEVLSNLCFLGRGQEDGCSSHQAAFRISTE